MSAHYTDQPVAPEAERHIAALVDYWGAHAVAVPPRVFSNPALGPADVRGHLERLKQLLSPSQYADLRSEITRRADFPTIEARLAERARLVFAEVEREREAELAAELAVAAARVRAQGEREAALRLAAALRQLEPAISRARGP